MQNATIRLKLVKIFPFCHLSALCVLGGKQIRLQVLWMNLVFGGIVLAFTALARAS